ncbi:acyl-CoA dehydrogenase family protein [Streptomyces sp. NPDC017991]|uniref:acyl-CoA dehydrogenase family protein n=1 Tax=Streptomyces sp. NPDC017991 TaxID=3365026 RepID=UPI00378AD95C
MASADSLTVPEAPALTATDVPLPVPTGDPTTGPSTGLTAPMRERLAAAARDADASGEPDRPALALLRETGLLGLALPYEYGGTGADAHGLNSAVARVAQVNASASIMLFQHYAVSRRILEHGSPALRRRLLPQLARGDWLAASAWSETGAGANKKHLSTVARRTSDGGWVLNGAKSFTTSAGLADIYLVLAQTEEPAPDAAPDTGYGSAGQTFFLIPADAPGLEPDTSLRLTGMRGSATGFVSVHDCHVPDSARLGPIGAAASIIAGVRDSGATLGAVSVGLAEAALDLAHRHAERRGLLAQQAVRHRLVDIAGEVEAARAVVERAGRRTADDPGIATLHSKLVASSAAERVINAVERLLGSAGYVASNEINRYGRDARAVALMGPTNDLCKELVSLTWNR